MQQSLDEGRLWFISRHQDGGGGARVRRRDAGEGGTMPKVQTKTNKKKPNKRKKRRTKWPAWGVMVKLIHFTKKKMKQKEKGNAKKQGRPTK